jgi:hypothetical protein
MINSKGVRIKAHVTDMRRSEINIKFKPEDVKGRDHLGDLSIYCIIMLKRTLWKQGVKM